MITDSMVLTEHKHFVKISSFITLNFCSTSAKNSSIASESLVVALLLPLVEGRGVAARSEEGTVWQKVPANISMVTSRSILTRRMRGLEGVQAHTYISGRHDAGVFVDLETRGLVSISLATNRGKLRRGGIERACFHTRADDTIQVCRPCAKLQPRW
jgi:hypothetical protein